MAQLNHSVAGFLCTDVDREGTMTAQISMVWKAARGDIPSNIAAGGIKTRREISALEKMEMDAAVGMAMYKNGFADSANRSEPSANCREGEKLTQIRIRNVLLHHPLSIEERSVDRNRVLHDFQEFRAIVVVHRQNHAFQLVIKRFRFRRVVGRSVAAAVRRDSPMHKP